ncbi:MAG: metal-dependent transcriptional regulator [Thermoflexales bacterium]|nr:metal-dependent transcriptional regulator [Thermoflexales bacterium]
MSILSESMQDYLKVILELIQSNQRATTNALAARLNVTPASVTGMLKRLAELNLVEYEPYQGAELTPAGRRVALEVVRHHRLLELYLIEAMGYRWDEVHAEAERLEHAISQEFAERMARILGDPKVDPHGDPIPTREGEMPVPSHQTLCEVQAGTQVQIQRVRDEDAEVLRKLAALGLFPRTVLTVIDYNLAQHTQRVRLVDGAELEVQEQLARHIFVAPVHSDESPSR